MGEKGDTGEQGMQGPQGDPGVPGAGGVPNLPDDVVVSGCLQPCHAFNGVVEQWKTSRHYQTYLANAASDEVESWTGKKSCGNCHAIDGVEGRIEGNVTYSGTTAPEDLAHGQLNYVNSTSSTFAEGEISYNGSATVALVHCSTCHDTSEANDPHITNKTWEAGDFPLRVPSGSSDHAIIEKSSAVGMADGTEVNYRTGNACIWCHKSRKDAMNYITSANSITSTSWGPHNGPHSDIYTAKGGYHYSGKTYRASTHTGFAKGCVQCHMPAIADNKGVANHSFYAQLSACNSCHSNPPSFDVGGAQSEVKQRLQLLRVELNTDGLLTQDGTNVLTSAQLTDGHWELDKARPQGATTVSAAAAGALYNYFLVVRGSAFGVHNPFYTNELLFDSIEAMGGTPGFPRP
jgi:hypothetical protein